MDEMTANTNQPAFATLRVGAYQSAASTGQRAGAFVLDFLFYLASAFVVGIVLAVAGLASLVEGMDENLVGLLLYALYYIIQEAQGGRTLGKVIMGTKAVSEDGSPLRFAQAVKRTLCRLIPFEALSFLAVERGWHDSMSGTRVVSMK